jgi:protein TonB
MFNNLLESRPVKQRSTAGAITSFVIHVVVVVGAVYATLNAGQKEEGPRVEEVKFVETPKQDEPKPEEPPPPPPPDIPVVPTPPKGFQVLTAPVEIPDVIPDVDLSKKAIDPADFSGKGVAGGRATGVGSGPPIVESDQPLFEFQVEKPAMASPGSPNPRYPDILRSAGVEGEVLVQFVVDTLGRAEVGTFKVLRTSHELFAAAVRNTLPNMRFIPAEVGGRKVKQLVQQPFVFAIQK